MERRSRMKDNQVILYVVLGVCYLWIMLALIMRS